MEADEQLEIVRSASEVLHALAMNEVHVGLPTADVAVLLGLPPEELLEHYGILMCAHEGVSEALFSLPESDAPRHPMVAIMEDYADFLAEQREAEQEEGGEQ